VASIDDLTMLKKQVEAKRNEASRAAGALEQVMLRLKNEFSCNTKADADALLEKLKRKEAKARAAFDAALENFQSDHAKELEGN
jgi:hypothetical protein